MITEKINDYLNRINTLLSDNNVDIHFSILDKNETLNRIDSDLEFIDKYKDKMVKIYVNDSMTCLKIAKEMINDITTAIGRDLYCISCISWRYFEGDKDILTLRDGLVIGVNCLLFGSEDELGKIYEIKYKVSSILVPFVNEDLIEKIKDLDY